MLNAEIRPIRPTSTLRRRQFSRLAGSRRLAGGTRVVASSSTDALDALDANVRAALAGNGWPNALQLPSTARHRPAVPSLSADARHYVNLTNGAEALPLLRQVAPLLLPPPRYCRLTSTACERQDLARGTLAELADASLLMDLALGETVVIWDCGSRRRRRTRRRKESGDEDDDKDANDANDDDGTAAPCPRALWYGMEFSRWALHTLWFDSPPTKSNARAYLRGHNVAAEWTRALAQAPPSLLKRLRYFGRYVSAERRLAAAGEGEGDEGRGVEDTGPFALRLYGCYKGTTFDGDSGHYARLVQEDARARASAAAAAEEAAGVERDERGARKLIIDAGWRVFAGGVGHEEMAGLIR